MISNFNKCFLLYFYIGYKGVSIYGNDLADPMKSFVPKFNCTVNQFENAHLMPFFLFTLLHCHHCSAGTHGILLSMERWTPQHKHRTVQIYLYNIAREKAMLESILNSCFSPTMPCDDIICFTYSCQIRLSIARLIIWNTSRIC